MFSVLPINVPRFFYIVLLKIFHNLNDIHINDQIVQVHLKNSLKNKINLFELKEKIEIITISNNIIEIKMWYGNKIMIIPC